MTVGTPEWEEAEAGGIVWFASRYGTTLVLIGGEDNTVFTVFLSNSDGTPPPGLFLTYDLPPLEGED